MRIVQSFIPTNYQQDIELYLDLTETSVNSILQFYDEVVLYTTPAVAELIKDRKIKYTEINTELFNITAPLSTNYAIPKIQCYLDQKTPFIHIDYDVILLSKIPVEKDFTIGYYDFDFTNNTVKHDQIDNLYNYYIQDLKRIHHTLSPEIQATIDLRLLPNFSIFGVNNLTLCKTVFKEVLKFYNENKLTFEELEHAPSMLEQFLFITYLRYFLNWEVDPENVVSKVENYAIEPQEYITGSKQYAKFLHLQGPNKSHEFLNKLLKYLYER